MPDNHKSNRRNKWTLKDLKITADEKQKTLRDSILLRYNSAYTGLIILL